MRWYSFFTIFCYLVDEKIKLKVLACSFEITLILKKNPSSNPLQEDPKAAILTLVMLTGTRLWFCKIIPEAACGKLILAHFPCSRWDAGNRVQSGSQASKCLYCHYGPHALCKLYSDEYTGLLWQPSEDSNALLAHFLRQTAIIVSCAWSVTPTKKVQN
jgi:hypothetical protein